MIEKRIIFLDIDGVLNHQIWYDYLWSNYSRKEIAEMPFEKYNISPFTTQLLNQLEGAEVVISSSWNYDEKTVRGLREAGLKLPIIGGITHYSIDQNWLCRGNDIARWLNENGYEHPMDIFFKDGWYITHKTFGGTLKDILEGTEEIKYAEDSIKLTYVIIDDDSDMLFQQKDHFIHVDYLKGLTQEDINKAKKILNL